MPVDSHAAEYDHNAHFWQREDDVDDGQDAVWQRCWETANISATNNRMIAVVRTGLSLSPAYESYLPRLEGQTDLDYATYLMDSEFFGATGRTIDGLVGAVFRVDPEIVLSPQLVSLKDDCDRRGTPMMVFARQALRAVVKYGRYGVFVDMPLDGGGTAQPYLCGYKPDAIINWRVDLVNGRLQLTRVVLREAYTESDPDDPFNNVERCRYRVLDLADGVYQVQVYYEEIGDDGKIIGGQFTTEYEQPLVPTRQGKPLDVIPFTFLGATSLDPCVGKSPILDLVNVNLHHFRLSAKLNHGLFVIGLPQPIVIGDVSKVEGQPAEYRIGSNVAWMLPTGADAKYLEFAGPGLASIKDEMQADEARMVLLGARLLESQKRQAETAEALRLRQAGESATLATIADTVTWGLTTALGWAAEWVGANPAQNYLTLNQEFAEATMSEDEAVLAMRRWQGGAATLHDLYWIYKKGGRIDPDVTEEEWILQLEEQGPKVPALAPFGSPPPRQGVVDTPATGQPTQDQRAQKAA